MLASSIIVVVGPTSSGKSALAVRLAKKFNGEIISADSRQVYKGLDIGSGKITKREMRDIPHHLLDVASPRRKFTVAQYQKFARLAMQDIISRGKVPIICGGTGFYIDALLGRVTIPSVSPNTKLRVKLEKLSTEKLGEKLKILDPKRFTDIDQNNRPRLIRAIEIAVVLGQVPPLTSGIKGRPLTPKGDPWNSFQIGIRLDQEKLRKNIHERLLKRFRLGLIAEVKKLHQNGLSWKRLEALGLEYRYIARYLQNKLTEEEMLKQLKTASWHYAKRQMTWWKHDKTIHWIKNYREGERLTRDFLKK